MRYPIDANTGLQSGEPVHGDEPAACYGIACPLRGQCRRYSALGIDDGLVWAQCRVGDEWPKFVRIEKPDPK